MASPQTGIFALGTTLVPADSPGAGGSILLLQRWEHDAIAWEGLPVAAQESVIGRRKSNSAELDPSPPTSHVARSDQRALTGAYLVIPSADRMAALAADDRA
jgi:deferrochelatase/peroxidase EfeB